jgi:hypothetical protein
MKNHGNQFPFSSKRRYQCAWIQHQVNCSIPALKCCLIQSDTVQYIYLWYPSGHLHYNHLAKPLYGFTEGLGYHDSLEHLSKCRTAATAVLVSDYKPKKNTIPQHKLLHWYELLHIAGFWQSKQISWSNSKLLPCQYYSKDWGTVPYTSVSQNFCSWPFI